MSNKRVAEARETNFYEEFEKFMWGSHDCSLPDEIWPKKQECADGCGIDSSRVVDVCLRQSDVDGRVDEES